MISNDVAIEANVIANEVKQSVLTYASCW